MGVKPRAAAILPGLVNNSRSTCTWRQDMSVWSAVDKVALEWEVDLSPPWMINETLTFVAACAEKGLKAETVKQYLSSIRTRHKQLSKPTQGLEGYMLNAAISGMAKTEAEKAKVRGAVTPAMLRTLKARAYVYANNMEDEAILWLTCTLLYHCALRGSEILGTKADEIVEDKTMLWSALSLQTRVVEGREVEVLKVLIKGQKQMKGKNTQSQELYATESDLCPVAALKRVYRCNPRKVGPVARWTSGILITSSFINKFLRESLENEVDWETSPITTHSFRAGLPTLLSHIGEQDATIQDSGRWKSTAYKLYQKEGSKNQGERLKLFKRIGAAM